MEHEFELYSDLHKDVYGFRPTRAAMEDFNALPYAKKKEEWDYLCDQLEREMEREKLEKIDAIARFETRVHEACAALGVTRETYLRWEMDAADVDGDIGYFEWQNGLPYDHLKD